MTQLGEAVDDPDLFLERNHSKDTCPWHEQFTVSAEEMEEEDPHGDTPDAMPPNAGAKLKRSLEKAEQPHPDDESKCTVDIEYLPGAKKYFTAGRKRKVVQLYEQAEDDDKVKPYKLQYAPHHLIPGNESLKNSEVAPWLGEHKYIKKFAESSHIKKDKGSVGYNVNCHENGVWLPSPYALSNKNGWPSEEGMDVLKKRGGVDLATTEEFKKAYVARSIEVSGGHQFHMRHVGYSDFVRKVLDEIGSRLYFMTQGLCPEAPEEAKGKEKFDPPFGLPARLHVLSANLKRHLLGDQPGKPESVWHDPLFTDEMTKEYALDKKNLKYTKAKLKVDKVL